MIIVEGFIQQYGNNLYLGYIPKFKGLVVQGGSIKEIKRELLTSLKVKIAYDYGLDINKIRSKELKSVKDLNLVKGKIKQEYKFEMAL
jgi:hypothetical protein